MTTEREKQIKAVLDSLAEPEEEIPQDGGGGLEPGVAIPVVPVAEAVVVPIQGKKVRPRRLNEEEEEIALRRKWRLTYPERDIPGSLERLRTIIPSGLKKGETRLFLLGSFEEAKWTFLKLFNISRTKVDFREKIAGAGVVNALKGFDKPTQHNLKEVIRFLPDGEDDGKEKNTGKSACRSRSGASSGR